MKISPMTATGAVVGAIGTGPEPQSMVQKLRSLKMNTNATPGRVIEEAPPDAELTISAISSDTAPAATEEPQPLSPQLAAIARAKRALQVKEREIADREKALQAQTPAQGDVITKAQLKSDPLSVLQDAGVTYEQMTQAILDRQNGYNPEIHELKQKIADLESGIDKKLTDRDAQTEQAALKEMRSEAIQLTAQGEDFELVRETRSIPQVMQLIERTYRQTGEVLDVREALKLVEAELVKDGLKLANFKKIQSQFSPPAPAIQPMQPQRQMRTLTNRLTASVPMDRKARALAAFQGTLKK